MSRHCRLQVTCLQDCTLQSERFRKTQVVGTPTLDQPARTITSHWLHESIHRLKMLMLHLANCVCPCHLLCSFLNTKGYVLIAVLKQENYFPICQPLCPLCIRQKILLNIFKNLAAHVLVPKLLLHLKSSSPNLALTNADVAFQTMTGTFPTSEC